MTSFSPHWGRASYGNLPQSTEVSEQNAANFAAAKLVVLSPSFVGEARDTKGVGWPEEMLSTLPTPESNYPAGTPLCKDILTSQR